MTRQEPLSGKGVGLYPNALEHILYVNGQYRGEDDLGKLMHDFLCNDSDDMEVSGDGSNGSYLGIMPDCIDKNPPTRYGRGW